MVANVVFRCDGSPLIGAGHMMRCLALAETMAGLGYRPHFLSIAGSADVLGAIGRSGFPIIEVAPGDAGVGAAINAGVADARIAVVDGYALGADIEQAFAGYADTVIAFDDMPNRDHHAAILVDPTPDRIADAYAGRVGPKSIVLAGSVQALIRPLWRSARHERSASGDAHRIFVSLGATDPGNATSRVIEALILSGLDWEVDVVLGATAPYRKDVEARLGSAMTLHVDPDDLPGLLSMATLAIGAPGSSSFERALMGVPSIVIPLADNQRAIAAALDAAGAAEVLPNSILDDTAALGRHVAALASDTARRNAMADAASALCDGRGALRLLAIVSGKAHAKDGTYIRLRLAEPADSDWLLALQSRPETRRFARTPEVPSATGHARWYAGVMADPDRILLIVESGSKACGFVRLDRQASEAGPRFEISITIDSDMQGRGIGAAALQLARRFAPGATIDATVFAANNASQALFANAGYDRVGPELFRSLPQ